MADTDRTELADIRQLEYAQSENRVILSADEDFLRLDREHNHAGIIFLADQEMDVGEAIREISRIIDSLDTGQMENHVEFVSP